MFRVLNIIINIINRVFIIFVGVETFYTSLPYYFYLLLILAVLLELLIYYDRRRTRPLPKARDF